MVMQSIQNIKNNFKFEKISLPNDKVNKAEVNEQNIKNIFVY